MQLYKITLFTANPKSNHKRTTLLINGKGLEDIKQKAREEAQKWKMLVFSIEQA